MNMNKSAAIIWGAFALLPALLQAAVIDTVFVGNAGNPPNPAKNLLPMTGTVVYSYRIGTTEVTNAQYAEFLNAKAQSDPFELHQFLMGSEARGGIVQSGISGSFSYSVKPNMADKPVTYVGFWDSIRFVNWLSNGQGSGDTETGTYTLLGGTPTPTNANSISRNPGTTWVLPTRQEWYKAASYDPRTTAEGGPPADGHYWIYPTQSNSDPAVATANAVGDIANPGPNVTNHSMGADWNGQNGNVTTVGSAGPLSTSYYGTYDQGGNLTEWNETLTEPDWRGIQGGNWQDDASGQQSLGLAGRPTAAFQGNWLGFRVAYAPDSVPIPEPSSFVLAALGLIGLVVWRRRKR